MDPGSSAEARRRTVGRGVRARATVAIWLGLGGVLPLGVRAAEPVAGSVSSIVRDLDSDEIAVREHATRQLASMLDAASLTRSTVAAAGIEGALIDEVRGGRLSLEQRQRVLEVMREHFMHTPRGAVGVQFDVSGPTQAPGMRIQALVAGFPANERGVLRVGDVIERVLGIPVGAPGSGLRAVQPLVASHDPGDFVEMTIVRPDDPALAAPGQPGALVALVTEGEQRNATRLTRHVPLGSYADLGGGGFLGRANLESAWLACVDRMGLQDERTPTVVFELTSSDWLRKATIILEPVDGMRFAGSGLPAAYEDPTRAERAAAGDLDLAEVIRRNNVRIGRELLPGGNMNAARNAALVEKLRLVDQQNRQAEEVEAASRQIRALGQQLEALKIAQRNAKTMQERERLDAQVQTLKQRIISLMDQLQRQQQPRPARP